MNVLAASPARQCQTARPDQPRDLCPLSHPPHRDPLQAKPARCRRCACCRCRCRMRPLPATMTPPLLEGKAERAQEPQLPPPPLSQPSAACTLSCGRFPPSSSAPADAPAGRGGLTRVPTHRSQTASPHRAAVQSSKPSVTRAPGSSTSPSCSRCSASASPPACGCGRRKVARTGSSPPGSSPAAAPPRRARHGP